MSVQFTEADEHLLSRLEVEITRGLEEQYDQEAARRLVDYCAAFQDLLEVITEAIAAGGEPMRVWLQQQLGPRLERTEANIRRLMTEFVEE